MKTRLILFFVLAFAMISLASIIFPPYNKLKSPSLSLPDAYYRAAMALGDETNRYHCVSANITTSFSPDGEWYFTFYPNKSNSIPRLIAVEFDGKVDFDNGAR